MRYRLGLDLGTNSLGWAVIELDEHGRPFRLVRVGSRIFSDGRNPKDGSSKAVERRGPRQMRRRRDRYLRRRKRYIQALIAAGLFPSGEAEQQGLLSLNPYRLRAEGLERELTPYEFGRALFHLQQRRGFKSNRKTDKVSADADKDPGKIKSAIAEFAGELGGSTVGAALWRRIQNGDPARARLIGSGPKASYTFYVSRDMVADEFDALWDAQERFIPGRFRPTDQDALRDVLLYQRDLLPAVVGRCYFERAEPRAAIALPSSQRFRLYQEVNHLRLIHVPTLTQRALTRDERDRVIDALRGVGTKKLTQIRKLLLGAAEARYWKFTLEDEKRTELKGDQVSAKLSASDAFGEAWFEFSVKDQDAIIAKLLDEANERELVEWLLAKHDLTSAQAEHISNVQLPGNYLRLSSLAISKIFPRLVEGWDDELDQPLTYDKAAAAAGYHHSDKRRAVLLDELPYYGELLSQYTMPTPKSSVGGERDWGKIGNPTVHIGLNQVRKVVNALVKCYGLPEQIVVELARALKLNEEQKREIKSKQKADQDQNDQIRRELARLGQTDNYDNRLRIRLFNELVGMPKTCVYSGRAISLSALFTNEFQVDHILPMSVTLDNSYANKLLSHQSANKYKARRSPYEAFGASADGYSWPDIMARAESLPPNKQRRFSPEAMLEDGDRKDFLARQLSDTQYLARVAKQYLDAICADVWVTPGRLTALLRGKWNLNSILSDSGKKERTDHRHHAIDAAVIAVTDRSLLQQVSTAAARAEDRDLDKLFDGFPDPWPGFREDLVVAAQRTVVSHKPDHGTGSALHNETAYGIVSGPDSTGKYRVRHRIPIEHVRQKHLDSLQVSSAFRDELDAAILTASGEPEIAKNLGALKLKSGRRSVRHVETLSVIPLYRRGQGPFEGGEPYKAYKGDSNYCYEIFRTSTGKWDGRVISSFEAQSNEYKAFMKSTRFRTTTWSGEDLVMRIMSEDTLAIEIDAVRSIMRVQKLSPGQIALAGHHEGNVDARTRDKDESYRMTYKTPGSLAGVRARRVFVDPIGRVKDPGFRE